MNKKCKNCLIGYNSEDQCDDFGNYFNSVTWVFEGDKNIKGISTERYIFNNCPNCGHKIKEQR